MGTKLQLVFIWLVSILMMFGGAYPTEGKTYFKHNLLSLNSLKFYHIANTFISIHKKVIFYILAEWSPRPPEPRPGHDFDLIQSDSDGIAYMKGHVPALFVRLRKSDATENFNDEKTSFNKRDLSNDRMNHLVRFSKRTPRQKRTSLWVSEYLDHHLKSLVNEIQRKESLLKELERIENEEVFNYDFSHQY